MSEQCRLSLHYHNNAVGAAYCLVAVGGKRCFAFVGGCSVGVSEVEYNVVGIGGGRLAVKLVYYLAVGKMRQDECVARNACVARYIGDSLADGSALFFLCVLLGNIDEPSGAA